MRRQIHICNVNCACDLRTPSSALHLAVTERGLDVLRNAYFTGYLIHLTILCVSEYALCIIVESVAIVVMLCGVRFII